jgi:hypothetical protein
MNLAVDLTIKAGKSELDPAAWYISARKWMEKSA